MERCDLAAASPRDSTSARPRRHFEAFRATNLNFFLATVGVCALIAQPVTCVVLGEDLNVSYFDGRVEACSYPEVADNNTCACAPGFTLKDSVCTACALGSYTAEAGERECTLCPDHHTTFPNASEAADCICTYGYEPAVEAQTCSPCAPGFYKAFRGNNACQPCTGNATTPLAGSVSAGACLCLPGFQGAFDTGCAACPVDFYRREGDDVCRSCPLHTGTREPATADDADCVCKPGFAFSVSACIPCPPGAYKPVLAMLGCSACPANSSSPDSSTSREDCVCHAGFFHDYGEDAASFSCAPCTAGYWCPGQRAMHPCTANSLSERGATSRDQCICARSMFKQDDTCLDCPLDSYCPGDSAKYACPGNSAAPERSEGLSDCVCDGGFEKQAGA